MTDRDLKKAKGTNQRSGLLSATHERRKHAAAPADPFDDDEGLDELLEKSLGGIDEPRLVLRERLLSGTRVRREV